MSENDELQVFPSMMDKGMTLRDYFAAKAMQARAQEFLNHDHDHLADWAYTIADAMLEARKSQKEKV